MKKGKVKEFFKKHEKVILGFAAGLGVAGLATIVEINVKRHRVNKILDECYLVTDETMTHVFKDAIEKGLNPGATFAGVSNDPIKLGELGELGKQIIAEGAPEDLSFTHFIAIGEAVEH
jgi:hypothetical protein